MLYRYGQRMGHTQQWLHLHEQLEKSASVCGIPENQFTLESSELQEPVLVL